MSYEKLNEMLGGIAGMRVSMSPTNPYRIIGEKKDCYGVLYSSLPILDSQTGEPMTERMEFNLNNMYKGIQTELKLNSTSFELLYENETLIFDREKGEKIFPSISGFYKEGCGKLEITFRTQKRYYLVNMGDYCMMFNHSDRMLFSITGYEEKQKKRLYFETMSDGTYHKVVLFASFEEKCVLSFNAYLPKLLFDTPIDEKIPERNNVYGEIAYLGNGGQRLQTRFDLQYFNDLYTHDIISAKLYVPRINGKGKLEFGFLLYMWCSFTTSWNSREEPTEWFSAEETRDGYVIELADYFRDIFTHKYDVTPGLVLRSIDDEFIQIPTGDNYMYPIYLKLKLKKEHNEEIQ